MLKNCNTTEAILEVLRDKRSMKNTLLSRGDDELNYLVSILKQGAVANRISTISDMSSDFILTECKICPDIIERKAPYGSGSNKVMIILNAPRMANRIEISIHRTESVDLLRKMIAATGLEMKECYITNLIKCETSSSIIKPSDMVKNCTKVLQREIETIGPQIVIVMGDILPLQGIINSSKSIFWFNTEHTIALIKNPELKRPAWETLKLVRKKFLELNNDTD